MSNTNQIIRQVANTVVSQDHIMQYLNVVANNIHMSVLNQAMIYFQNPAAKMVCGKEAWNKMGRAIRPNAAPIVLFLPDIKMIKPTADGKLPDPDAEATFPVIYMENARYVNEYIPVNAFNVADTTGAPPPEHEFNYDTIMDNVLRLTNATCQYAKHLHHGSSALGEYDKQNNIFYLSDKLSDLNNEENKRDTKKAMLSAYLEYIFDTYSINDKLLKYAILHVLSSYYGFSEYEIKEITFKKLDQRSESEKIAFLSMLQFFTSNIVQDFDGYYLSFDETALVNNMLYTKDFSKVNNLFHQVARYVNDDLLRNEILNLRIKLSRMEEEQLTALYTKRNDEEIYTYPPCKINLDITDYLKEDRKKLMSDLKFTIEDAE